MQRMLTVIALIGTTTFAAAEGSGPDNGLTVSQISLADQIGFNEIIRSSTSILNGNNSNRVEDVFVRYGDGDSTYSVTPAGAIDQSILNAVNLLLSSDTVIENAEQTMLGTQSARNLVAAGAYDNQISVDQTGENLANIIVAEQVNSVRQAFGPGATQEVYNELSGAAAGISGVTQTGRNTANVVLAKVSIGSGEQLFPADTTQMVDNLVALDKGTRLPAGIVQSGTNIGNVLIADDVRDVVRIFNGDQIVRNTVSAADGNTPRGVTQSGLNIANFVSAKTVEGLTQVSDGRQIVENSIEGVTLADMSGRVRGYSYSSTNIVNLLDIRSSDTPSVGTTINAVQTANQPQRVQSDSGSHTQVGNVSTITR